MAALLCTLTSSTKKRPKPKFWTPKKCIELILANLPKSLNDSAAVHKKWFLKKVPKQTSGPPKIASNLSKPTCQNVSMTALLCTQKSPPNRVPKQTSGPPKNTSNSSKPTCQNVSMAKLLCTQKRLGPCWVRLSPCWVRLGPCWVRLGLVSASCLYKWAVIVSCASGCPLPQTRFSGA